jgi:hypothetical protein
MEVSVSKEELLVDWAKRKAKKDALRMLILLSGRMDTVSGAYWTCQITSGKLALVNLELEEQKYFAVGFGLSYTQAKKNAAKKILKESNIINWIEEHYPNHTTLMV